MKNKIFSKGLYFLIFTAIFAVLPLSASAATYVSGTISTDTVWTASSSPYVVQGIVALDQYRTLTIEPGVVVKFDTGALLHAHGTLNAQGTTEDKIYFTSIKDDSIGGDTNGDGDASVAAPGDWGFLNISTYLPRSPLSSIKNIVVRYGGGVDYNTTGAAVIISDSGLESIDNSEFAYNKVGLYNEYDSVEITNSNFHHNEIGVYSAPRHRGWGATRILTFNNNTISDNSLYGVDIGYYKPTYGVVSSSFDFNNNIFTNNPTALRVYSNTILSHSNNSASGGDKNGILIGDGIHPNTNWNADNIPYIIDGNIYYRGGTLTIDPGTVIKFTSPESILDIHARVFLHINGTQDEPVYFTSIKDDSVGGDTNGDGSASVPAAGDWGYVSIGEGSSNIGLDINYMKVRYGGGSFFRNNIYPALALSFNWYQYTLVKDYYLENIEVSNSKSGLYVHSVKHRFHLSNSSIHDNEDYGLYAYTYFRYGPNGEVDAQNNWWGDASGPYQVDQNPSGLGNEISGDVPTNASFDPWLTEDPLVSTPTCCSSVVFLPGLEASRLYRPGLTLFSEDQLWYPNTTNDIQNLSLSTTTGESIDPNVYTRDVLDEVAGTVNIYKGFLSDMNKLVDSGTIAQFEPMPYDWRKDQKDVAMQPVVIGRNGESYSMVQKIEELASTSQTGKVTIITHSNGGLVAKELIELLRKAGKSSLVEQLIMVAAPELGTPKAVLLMLHGENLTGPPDYVNTRELGENMKSAYTLLPSSAYFDPSRTGLLPSQNIIEFSTTTSATQYFRDLYGESISDYDTLRKFLLGDNGLRIEPIASAVSEPNVLKENFLENAETRHSFQDTWTPPEDIKVTEIVGWGLDTVNGIRYDATQKTICNEDKSVCTKQDIIDPQPLVTVNGDGTVVHLSAEATEGADRYWVDISEYNAGPKVNRDHKNILEVKPLIALLSTLVKNDEVTILPDDYIKSDQPQLSDAESRLRIGVHSPVTLHLYDNYGRHTGPAVNPDPDSDLPFVEEQIPNTYYWNIGEGQYAGVGVDTITTIKLTGKKLGTFTVDIDEVVGDESVSTNIFANIPTTENTIAHIAVGETVHTPVLLVDIDGDDNNDVEINPNEEVSDTDYLVLLRGVITTMDLSEKKEEKLIKAIDRILKSVEKEEKCVNKKEENAQKKCDIHFDHKFGKRFDYFVKIIEKFEEREILSDIEARELIDVIGKIEGEMVI
ncbi:right-handed parallel beta-helix repeat-containing protein [Patescibacteria group bacterium]